MIGPSVYGGIVQDRLIMTNRIIISKTWNFTD